MTDIRISYRFNEHCGMQIDPFPDTNFHNNPPAIIAGDRENRLQLSVVNTNVNEIVIRYNVEQNTPERTMLCQVLSYIFDIRNRTTDPLLFIMTLPNTQLFRIVICPESQIIVEYNNGAVTVQTTMQISPPQEDLVTNAQRNAVLESDLFCAALFGITTVNPQNEDLDSSDEEDAQIFAQNFENMQNATLFGFPTLIGLE